MCIRDRKVPSMAIDGTFRPSTEASVSDNDRALPRAPQHAVPSCKDSTATVRVRTPCRVRAHWLTAPAQLRGLAPPPVLVSISKTVPKMSRYSVSIDDYLAKASPVFGRMRLDGLTETAVPFAERAVLLWRRGTPTPDMDVDVLIDVLKVCTVSPSVLRGCARCSEFKCASPPR